MLTRDRDRTPTTRQTNPLGNLSDRTDLQELILMTRNKHNTLILANINRERDGHTREDHGVIERDQTKRRRGAGGLNLGCV
jgi:hypothetical protein